MDLPSSLTLLEAFSNAEDVDRLNGSQVDLGRNTSVKHIPNPRIVADVSRCLRTVHRIGEEADISTTYDLDEPRAPDISLRQLSYDDQ